MAKTDLTTEEKRVKRILRQAGGANALVADNLTVRDREILWEFWKSDRMQGHYSCSLCSNLTFCAGERYDLLVCRGCFLPEVEAPKLTPRTTPIVRKVDR